MFHRNRIDTPIEMAHLTDMSSTDPIAMLLSRRREIASEREELLAKIQVLEAEDQELSAAEKVLSRFGAPRADYVLKADTGTFAVTTTGKPPGTPTTPSMIIALLREAMAQGKQGLEPKDMQMAIARRWWPSVKSEDVAPTAWRLWKAGRLEKDGSFYRLPSSADIEKEAADLLERGDHAASK